MPNDPKIIKEINAILADVTMPTFNASYMRRILMAKGCFGIAIFSLISVFAFPEQDVASRSIFGMFSCVMLAVAAWHKDEAIKLLKPKSSGDNDKADLGEDENPPPSKIRLIK